MRPKRDFLDGDRRRVFPGVFAAQALLPKGSLA